MHVFASYLLVYLKHHVVKIVAPWLQTLCCRASQGWHISQSKHQCGSAVPSALFDMQRERSLSGKVPVPWQQSQGGYGKLVANFGTPQEWKMGQWICLVRQGHSIRDFIILFNSINCPRELKSFMCVCVFDSVCLRFL